MIYILSIEIHNPHSISLPNKPYTVNIMYIYNVCIYIYVYAYVYVYVYVYAQVYAYLYVYLYVYLYLYFSIYKIG